MHVASQTERTILALREMVLRGDFRPGERLTELSLTEPLKASRTPVRLALDRLAHEGLLEALPTAGFVVREFSLNDIWDAIELRGVLEGTAARLAAERTENPAELARLRELCGSMESIVRGTVSMDVGDFVRYLELNEAFHLELRRLSRSRWLSRTIESVALLPFAAPGALVFGEAESPSAKREAEIAQEHHRSLLEAIENREGTRAEHLAREHSRVARRNLARALSDRAAFGRIPGAALINLDIPQAAGLAAN